MELANYDWLLSEPSGHASSFLMDLIAFLQSTFQAFTNLKVIRQRQFFGNFCTYFHLLTNNRNMLRRMLVLQRAVTLPTF